jgi:hypothetical protein
MNNKHIFKAVLVNLVLAIICATAAFAESVKGIQVLKIAAQDERAVIKTPKLRGRCVRNGHM